jgi:hypothetical protein
MRNKHYIAGLALIALSFGGGAGENSNPVLTIAELPRDILNDCAALTVRAGTTACGETAYGIRWVNRTRHGHLYLVERTGCESGACRAWFVEKNSSNTRIVLNMKGRYTLERVGGAYPVVEIRQELTDSYASYSRYQWNGERYTRADTRLVHNIDGVECATEEECRAKADEALSRNRADRAVRIWQQVHGVEWI